MNAKTIWVALALSTTSLGCQAAPNTIVPDELLGVWTTSAPKYADRFFEITAGAIIFDTGKPSPDIHPIANIETVHDLRPTLYTISYLSEEGQEHKFSFYYDPAHGGVIRFKNQQHISWMKGRG
ncbi:MAG: hypothetical protein ACE5NA_10400 [Nitrospiraceae bacterium]